ncbi:MAG: hypothetical protein ABR562_03890 [Thermoplasmatota archaeon]
MRVLLALALLAGCAAPPPAFTPACPAWSQGLSPSIFHEAFDGNSTGTHQDFLGAGLLRDEGRALDRVVLDFHARGGEQQGIEAKDARIEARFHREDDGRELLAYDPARGAPGPSNPGQPLWSFSPGTYTNFTLHIDLSQPGAQPGAPSAVVVEWTLHDDLDGNPATASRAFLYYSATYQYRVC